MGLTLKSFLEGEIWLGPTGRQDKPAAKQAHSTGCLRVARQRLRSVQASSKVSLAGCDGLAMAQTGDQLLRYAGEREQADT